MSNQERRVIGVQRPGSQIREAAPAGVLMAAMSGADGSLPEGRQRGRPQTFCASSRVSAASWKKTFGWWAEVSLKATVPSWSRTT